MTGRDATTDKAHTLPPLRARRLGVLTSDDPVVFMRTDCHVCRSEGLSSRTRVLLLCGDRSLIATLYQVSSDLLASDEAGLSEAAWQLLGASDGDVLDVRHPEPLSSFAHVRSRIFGNRLGEDHFRAILTDVAARRYSAIETSAYLVSGAQFPLDREETRALTRVMVDIGERLAWGQYPIVDKHSIGGLPGNRTTPIVVAIVTALGLIMPKTSSRAITSPAGTADAMETLAPVDLDIPRIRRVVEREGGCVVWGGAVRLSPADDLLIRVERVLDIDSEGQLVASVLSKKVAAGSSHVVFDLPVGATAKVRSHEAADRLAAQLLDVAASLGIVGHAVVSDGTQPVGRGIGPALEARDVLAVLRQEAEAPRDLHDRACTIAGAILELAGTAGPGEGFARAAAAVRSGAALRKFERICEAQGGMRTPPVAPQRRPVVADRAGTVLAIDNRRLARAAKLAGAPGSPAAGLELHIRVGGTVVPGQPLFTLHAASSGELEYALDYVRANPAILSINPEGAD